MMMDFEVVKKITPMTEYQKRLFNFFYNEVTDVKSKAKKMCRRYVTSPDYESQLAAIEAMRVHNRNFGGINRKKPTDDELAQLANGDYAIEAISEDDYFFEDLEIIKEDNEKTLKEFWKNAALFYFDSIINKIKD
jgi:hypothetical protein